jgi:hypothetical protein
VSDKAENYDSTRKIKLDKSLRKFIWFRGLSRELTVNNCIGLDDDTNETTFLGSVKKKQFPSPSPSGDLQMRIGLIFETTSYARPGDGSGWLTFTKTLLEKTDRGQVCDGMSRVLMYSRICPTGTSRVEKVLVVMKEGKRKVGGTQYISTETTKDDKQVEK